jgi:hypothetical protein
MTTIPNSPSSGLPHPSDESDEGLTVTQRFDLELMCRKLEGCNDIEQVKKLAHTTMRAWYIMKSAIGNKLLEKLTSDHNNMAELMAQRAASQEPESDVDEKGTWSARVQNEPYDTRFQP